MHSPRPTRADRAPVVLLRITTTLFLFACASPDRAPLDAERVTLAVADRDVSAATLRAVIERAGLAPFALGALHAVGSEPDCDDAPFWQACALAYSPQVRAAWRDWLAQDARRASAGRPGAMRGTLEFEQLDDPGAQGRALLGVDVLGLFGLGRAATERELADAEARAARARLELAAWEATVAVDRARADLAAARAESQALAELLADVEVDARRTQVLDAHGRVSAEAVAAARIAWHRLEARRSLVTAREAAARAALARAAGLPSDAPELDRVSARTLERMRTLAEDAPVPERSELFARSPRLRAALVEYAVAEARLMDEAAARWPSLRLGPHLAWGMDELLLGAMAGSDIPWPGALEGRVRAAHAAREARREAAEDLFLAEEARARAASERTRALHGALERNARPAEVESRQRLAGAGARYAIDPTALTERAHTITLRIEVLERLYAMQLETLGAALDLRLISGPPVVAKEDQS